MTNVDRRVLGIGAFLSGFVTWDWVGPCRPGSGAAKSTRAERGPPEHSLLHARRFVRSRWGGRGLDVFKRKEGTGQKLIATSFGSFGVLQNECPTPLTDGGVDFDCIPATDVGRALHAGHASAANRLHRSIGRSGAETSMGLLTQANQNARGIVASGRGVVPKGRARSRKLHPVFPPRNPADRGSPQSRRNLPGPGSFSVSLRPREKFGSQRRKLRLSRKASWPPGSGGSASDAAVRAHGRSAGPP